MIVIDKADLALIKHKLYKAIGKTRYYENPYGIKAYNKPSIYVSSNNNHNKISIPADNLYLGFDGLKDAYSLIDITISMSPHFHMMQRILKGQSIEDSDYVLREKQGALDGRFEMKVNEQTLLFHVVQFEKTKNLVSTNNYMPVQVYSLHGRYYIIDGKHRAAMCALLGKTVNCEVLEIEELRRDEYINSLYNALKGKEFYIHNEGHLRGVLDGSDVMSN